MDLKNLFHYYLAKQDDEVATVLPPTVKLKKANKVKHEPKIVTSLAPVLIDPTKPRNEEDWDAI